MTFLLKQVKHSDKYPGFFFQSNSYKALVAQPGFDPSVGHMLSVISFSLTQFPIYCIKER